MIPIPIAPFLEIINRIFFLTGYVSNFNSFPKPLSSEEEKYYLEKYGGGDEKARNILIERNLRLVAHVVKKYGPGQNETDDLISIGTIGLIKAIKTFNYEKGTKLATYAARCIENEILMQMRSEKKRQNDVYLQDPIGTDKEGNEITLIDIIKSSGECVMDEVERNMQVIRLYTKLNKTLTDREKVIIEFRYGLLTGECKPQREIAKMLGISRSYVSRIEKKAIKKLTKTIDD